jgi:hypothetical protein
MKQPILIIWLFLFFSGSISAQKVTNVSNHQEQSTIIVSYDLETKSPCKISLFVSTNGGTTWQGPLKKVSGDIGVNVSSGSKAIIWNVLEEFEQLSGDNIVFKISANTSSLPLNPKDSKSLNMVYGSENYLRLKKSKKIWLGSAVLFSGVGTVSYLLSKKYYSQYESATTDAENLYNKGQFQSKIYPIAFGLAGFCGLEVILKSRRLNKADESHTSLNFFPLNNGGGIGLTYKFY